MPGSLGLPPYHAWQYLMIFVNSTEPKDALRISTPIRSCVSITFHSSLVSGPGLRRIESGTPSLPISCSRPATSRTKQSLSDINPLAIITQKSATFRLWTAVAISRYSKADIKAVTAEKGMFTGDSVFFGSWGRLCSDLSTSASSSDLSGIRSHRTTRFRPLFFAAYRALSAWSINSCGLSTSSSYAETPKLAVIKILAGDAASIF